MIINNIHVEPQTVKQVSRMEAQISGGGGQNFPFLIIGKKGFFVKALFQRGLNIG